MKNGDRRLIDRGKRQLPPRLPFINEQIVKRLVVSGNKIIMDYIDNVLEKLKEWARKVIDALLGPEGEPEPVPIPVPVNDRYRRQR